MKEKFCVRLRQARVRAGLSQGALADAVGVSRASIVRFESPKYKGPPPSLEMVMHCIDILHVGSVRYLLGLSDVPGLAGPLNSEERDLVLRYRALPPEQRQMMVASFREADAMFGRLTTVVEEVLAPTLPCQAAHH